MKRSDLNSNEYNPYYDTYISKSGTQDLNELLGSNHIKFIDFFESIPIDKHEFRYEEGKWTIKEIIQHLIDTERVFAYRALCIARQDRTLFPGFDQDAYVLSCDANSRTMTELISEYKALRITTIIMFNSFSDEMLLEVGIASNSNLSVRAAGFIIIGHENHHSQVIKERYL
ncbi:damage-inducible protein DinB [Flavobacteriales bacterium 34_180_T64]|nr:damage-inducible protein DinB [Flavobacteriales bacterium 34_180_T64]